MAGLVPAIHVFLAWCSQMRFQAKACPDLIRGGSRFASRKRVKSKNLEPRFDSIEAEKGSKTWMRVAPDVAKGPRR
jgi:hypothetical protein